MAITHSNSSLFVDLKRRLKSAQLVMKQRFNSFQTRLLLSSFLMVLILIPTLGIIINNAFYRQMQSSIESELRAFSYSILAVAEAEDQHLILPEVFLENQFNVIESGLYAVFSQVEPHPQLSKQIKDKIKEKQTVVWVSPSLFGLTLNFSLPSPELGESHFQSTIFNKRQHFIFSFSVSFSENNNDLPLTLHIIKDQSDFLQTINTFKHQLWVRLVILMLILFAIQVVWLTYTLRPLQRISKEIKAVESGDKLQVEHTYPIELQQLANQINVLLRTEQQQRQRYRNALSNLAHSLKTPLAVIQGHKELSQTAQQQITRINNTIEHQLKKAQSSGQAAWHVGIKVQPIGTKLINSLNKIYQEKQLTISFDITKEALFKGDESDLFELLGNLLDNACKAANKRVHLNVYYIEKFLVIAVADDGVGVTQEQKKHILNRGTRADTYEHGHGIGLAIVRDLVHSYQGGINIKSCEEFGGALFTLELPR